MSTSHATTHKKNVQKEDSKQIKRIAKLMLNKMKGKIREESGDDFLQQGAGQ